MIIETKTCTACNEKKSLSEFYVYKRIKSGTRNQCIPCMKKAATKIQSSSPEKAYTYMRKHHLKRKYAMVEAEYTLMFLQQDGCCAICNTPQARLSQKLAVDHNHSTGAVRELLCQPCNLEIGVIEKGLKRKVKLDRSTLENYIQKHNQITLIKH